MKVCKEIKIGYKFDRLTVVEDCGVQIVSKKKQRVWKCKCVCGNIVFVTTSKLNNGSKRSCGCLMIESLGIGSFKHGKSHSKEFNTWMGIKQRCCNSNYHSYKNYGGRGIKVCDRWLQSFENFYADMGEAPIGFSIDRIDVNGNYCPENCRWVDSKTQQYNKRNTFKITFNNVTETLSYWSEKTGIRAKTIHARIHDLKWSVERALTTPTMIHHYAKKHKKCFLTDL